MSGSASSFRQPEARLRLRLDMATWQLRFYGANYIGSWSTTIGASNTYTGPSAFDSTATITDNAAGIRGASLDDNETGESATATISSPGFNGTTAVHAEEVFIVRDAVTGQTFQITTLYSSSGTLLGTLSEQPLVNGRSYSVVDHDTYPDSAMAGDAAIPFAYGDFRDGVVDGTAGNDTIDASYRDIHGDRVDGLDGTGDTATNLTLNWTSFGGEGTNLRGGVTTNVGGMNVNVSYVNDGTGTEFSVQSHTSFFEAKQYTENGEQLVNTNSAYLYGSGAGNNSTVTLNFSPASGSTFASEVKNVTFRLNDLDSANNGFVDRVTLRAYDAAGNVVEVRLYPENASVSGNTVTANVTGANYDTEAASVLVQIPGPVARIEIDYDNAGTGAQGLYITSVNFDAITPTYADSINAGAGHDSIVAGLGNDTIDGGTGNDTILAGDGNDSVIAGDGNDSVLAGNGNDTVFGGLGSDYIDGGAGADSLSGGDGNDTVLGGAGNDTIDGGIGDDSLDGGADNDSILGGAGNDTLIGGTGADTLDGGDGNDLLDGGAGNDSIIGGNGDDTATGGAGADTISLGAGMDYADYRTSGAGVNIDLSAGAASGGDAAGDVLSGVDGLYGSAFNDTLIGFDGQDTSPGSAYTNVFYAGAGNDSLDGRGGDDSLFGEAGSDTILGGTGNDYIDGGADNDVLQGGTGNDTILGGTGNDTITGEAGADSIDGGDGDDSIDGGADNDSITGGLGNDTLLGGSGADTIRGGAGADNIDGGAENDSLFGDDGNDTIAGGTGNDTIDGGTGNDSLSGGDGADSILGGAGDDTLTGGAGADHLDGGAGDDLLRVGSGDTAIGGAGDDYFLIDPTALSGGTITIDGWETEEDGPGDRLDFNGQLSGRVTYTAKGTQPGGKSGYATLRDGTVVNFSNIETIICFARGTRILTPRGPVSVENLRRGDTVLTRDNGLQPIRWMNSRRVRAEGSFAPVRIAAGAMGNETDLFVSPQHRMLIKGAEPELLFGSREVLAAAKHLVNGRTVQQLDGGVVEYFHLMFDSHELIFAEGAITESFHPGDQSLGGLEDEAREELFALFPELRAMPASRGPTARLCLRAHEARLLAA